MQVKEILRAQFDSRKNRWKIVKKTYNGCRGWVRLGGNWYYTKEDTEQTIQRLVTDVPDLYKTEA